MDTVSTRQLLVSGVLQWVSQGVGSGSLGEIFFILFGRRCLLILCKACFHVKILAMDFGRSFLSVGTVGKAEKRKNGEGRLCVHQVNGDTQAAGEVGRRGWWSDPDKIWWLTWDMSIGSEGELRELGVMVSTSYQTLTRWSPSRHMGEEWYFPCSFVAHMTM